MHSFSGADYILDSDDADNVLRAVGMLNGTLKQTLGEEEQTWMRCSYSWMIATIQDMPMVLRWGLKVQCATEELIIRWGRYCRQ